MHLPGLEPPPGTAVFSRDGIYRYALTRLWSSSPRRATFIMLNPSTADGRRDDPTIRRCINFAKREGAGGLTVVNLYAYRATSPNDLWLTNDPIGPENDRVLADVLCTAGDLVIAAWGSHARAERVERLGSIAAACDIQLMALGQTKSGQPRHPLYLPSAAQLTPWAPLAQS